MPDGRPKVEDKYLDALYGMTLEEVWKPIFVLGYEHQFVGGGSDGNEVSALGIPTLDGLGAAGDGAHSANEYILIDQYIPRIAMLASFVLTI